MSNVFDRILASRPVNAQTARTMGHGFKYEPPPRKSGGDHWSAPPKMLPIPREATSQVGKTFGRFTVVGYFGNQNHRRQARWVVRCACGDYETRTHKSINHPRNAEDRCYKCRHTKYLARCASQSSQGIRFGERA